MRFAAVKAHRTSSNSGCLVLVAFLQAKRLCLRPLVCQLRLKLVTKVGDRPCYDNLALLFLFLHTHTHTAYCDATSSVMYDTGYV